MNFWVRELTAAKHGYQGGEPGAQPGGYQADPKAAERREELLMLEGPKGAAAIGNPLGSSRRRAHSPGSSLASSGGSQRHGRAGVQH